MTSLQSHNTNTRWDTVEDVAALYQSACERILTLAHNAIERHGRFLIVLAGGSTPKGVYLMRTGVAKGWL